YCRDDVLFGSRPARQASRREVIPALSGPRREQAMQAGPVECRPGIGLASRRDLAVAADVFDRAGASEHPNQAREHGVLRWRIGDRIGALELDADGIIIASL